MTKNTNNIKYKVKRFKVSPDYIAEIREIFKQREYLKPINYTNNSRYKNLRTLYDENRKVIVHETWKPMYVKEESSDTFYTVTLETENRLDMIANSYYDSPRYWWVIALANNIDDPFDVPSGTLLRIPSIYNVVGGDVIGN